MMSSRAILWAVSGCAILLAAGLGSARAEEETLVVLVRKPVSPAVLNATGFLYLADLGDAYLVQGDEEGLSGLASSGIAGAEVTRIRAGEDVFLLRPLRSDDAVTYSAGLIRLGRDDYLAKLGVHEIEDLTLLPFSKIRLLPGSFPDIGKRRVRMPPDPILPNPHIAGMVEQVSADTVWKYISQLSGREPVNINGRTDTLLTRYSLSWRVDHAADYLRERFEACGLDVGFHPYTVGKYCFYGACFVDSLRGWVVGNEERIYRTGDGGMSWVRQHADAPGHSFWSACFVDSLRGWVAGTGGKIFHTADGGETWLEQDTPVGMTLREVCMVDSLNGWVVGYAGTVLRTTDGGLNWTKIGVPTTHDLYGCDFHGPDGGWACGGSGTILHYDGTAWTAQASGTTLYLLDVDFSTPEEGLIVGWSRTILRTVDGGSTWDPAGVPADASAFLESVHFADGTSHAWVVGLNGTALHTDDGGLSWQLEETQTLFGLRWVRFLNDSEGWTVGYGSTVLHTEDGGQTWNCRRDYLPPEDLYRLKNVVATKPGTRSREEVIICGHFDSISEDPLTLAPGADDNASGTAAVIEAARTLAVYPFERTIKFICFSGEEQGLFGSGEYAGDASAAGDSIIGVFNFDMIGYADLAPEEIDVVCDPASEWLADLAVRCAADYVPSLPALKIIDANSVLSDHASFWKAGYHALLAIEDEEISYPDYHTTRDTLGNLSRSFTTDVVKMGVAAVAELARPDATSSVAPRDEEIAIVHAHPNPSASSIAVSFALRSTDRVKIAILDIRGRVIDVPLDHIVGAGRHNFTWNGRGHHGERVSPGIYFVRIETDRWTATAKAVILR